MERISETITRANLGANSKKPLPACRQKTMQLVTKYGDRTNFLKMCSPNVQTAFAAHPDACFFGNYPTLSEINAAYGVQMASQWLIPQLYDLTQYSNTFNMEGHQVQSLASIIALEYRWLKITELMLFFYRFKTGRYGRFYGSVDPMVIMTALREFVRDRGEAYEAHEREESARMLEESRKGAVTREEWLRMREKEK